MRASLIYYWRANVTVILAAAVACSVLTGALLVGDSVRGSLRDLTLERLGSIDLALLSESFIREELASELTGRDVRFAGAAPAIVVRGSVAHGGTEARASQVNIQGVGERFRALFPEDGDALRMEAEARLPFPPAVLNRRLADELGAAPGDQLVLSLERPSDVPRETLLGSTDPTDVVRSLRVIVQDVIPDRGVGRFGLAPHQSLPLDVFVELEALERALGQEGRVNAIFVPTSSISVEDLESALRGVLTLDDLGLEATARGDVLQLDAREIFLRPHLATAVSRNAAALGAKALPISTYLANSTRLVGRSVTGSRELLPYSTVTALDIGSTPDFGRLLLADGSPAPSLTAGEILIDEWAASDLGARAGDSVEMDYYEVRPREELVTRTASFRVRGVVAMEGLGADPSLTPAFPGISDAEDMSDWNPSFPVDLSLVADRDEAYWDRYRAAPKLFVAADVGPTLWGTRYGSLTSIRLAPGEQADAAELAADLESELTSSLALPEAGLEILPVRARGLEAAGGATDFGGLFIGFSLFLIVAAALLVGLFFRLGVERRAAEIGLLLATGFRARAVRRRFLAEGAVMAGLGTALGIGGAVAYAGGMMLGLRTWWVGATGSRFLFLHLEPVTLALGFVLSFGVVLFAVWQAARRLASLPVVGLLRGVTVVPGKERSGRRARWTLWVSLAVGLVLLVMALVLGESSAVGLFFGVGASLLVAGLAAFSLWLGRGRRELVERGGAATRLLRMAAASATLNPGRSLLSVALVSSACFVIVAVGANGLRFGEEVRRLDSGAGGFALVAESDIPIHHDLNDAEARSELGFGGASNATLDSATVMPFRVVPGDDVSCLNLYQPRRPRLMGVPAEQVARGGFQFQGLVEDRAAPWTLLDDDLGEDVIPAFGDYNSVMWILKSGLGKEVEMEDELGRLIKLRIVGLLRRSIFQRELLVSESRLEQHFPGASGYAYFLIDVPADSQQEVAQSLEQNLAPYGFDVTPTAQQLQSFQAVENTYLSTFQTLGGLGLLLGTVGLAVILLRSVLERRGELALLRAVGFRRRGLGWMVVAENTLLLVAGIAVGTVAALVAVAPHLVYGNAVVPWAALAITLLLVLAVGTLASIGAVRQALRVPLLPALRAE